MGFTTALRSESRRVSNSTVFMLMLYWNEHIFGTKHKDII